MLNFKGGGFLLCHRMLFFGGLGFIQWTAPFAGGHLLLQARGTEDLFLFAPCGPFDMAIHLNRNVKACINTIKKIKYRLY